MNIDEKTLTSIEKLAKLHVDENERESTVKKIVGVLSMLDKIDMNEIADLAPLHHPLEVSQPLRTDCAIESIDRNTLQSNAPQVQDGLFLVPKVIE